jgi:hypothetical protein
MNWHNFENKKVLGEVPVEADGSAHFEVPSDRFVFFQLLDKNKMMVQSMRTGTVIQSGEVQGCVGCHEYRNSSPAATDGLPLALQRPPSKLNGWYGPPREFSYQKEVQPVLDRHCVECHDFRKPAGQALNLAGDRTVVFNTSYTDLWGLGFLKCVGAGPARVQPAKSWGSHASQLVRLLRAGHPEHEGLQLDRESLDRIITWVDLNAPYYPFYESAYPNHGGGRSPLDKTDLARLGKLTGAPFVMRHGNGVRAQVSFDRPELSPCLQSLDVASAEYREALALIRKGQAKLQATPRADMENFEPCATDALRLEKYRQRMAMESRNRNAIREGRRVYDGGLAP